MSGIWELHAAFGLTILFCSMILLQSRKLGPFVLLWSYCVAYATLLSFWPEGFLMPGIPAKFAPNMKYANTESLACWAIPLVVFLPQYVRRFMAEIIAYIALINVIPAKIIGGGIFNVASFDLTVTAIATCYFLYRNKMIPTVIGTALVLICGGSTAWITLFLGTTVYIWQNHKNYRFVPFLTATAVIATFKVGSFKTRWVLWQESLQWWSNNANDFFGIGPGGFQVMGPFSHFSTGENPMWLHNDMVQFGIEYGTVGILLLAVCCLWLLDQLKGAIWIPIAAIFGASMGYFPFHFTLSAVLCVLIIYEGIEHERETKTFY